MKLFFYLSVLSFCFQGCLKCPDDYMELQHVKSKPLLTAVDVNTNDLTIAWSFTSVNEDEIKIERKTDYTDFILIDSTNINVYSYEDGSVLPHTNYTYRIFVVDNNSQSSDYSNQVSITTN